MDDETIKTRQVKADDLPYLTTLFAEDAMPLPQAADLFTGIVAVNAAEEPVGFIRILQIKNEGAVKNGNYVYPVIVFKSWQGNGVGSALIKAAQTQFGQLKLVACLNSRNFYPKCGFKPLDWPEVAGAIAKDCKKCPELPTCNPQPYILGD